jgi:hypothetical protein
MEKSYKQTAEAEQIANELIPLISQLPDLRHGSFSNAMEEVRLLTIICILHAFPQQPGSDACKAACAVCRSQDLPGIPEA